jgi:hypothetical protein
MLPLSIFANLELAAVEPFHFGMFDRMPPCIERADFITVCKPGRWPAHRKFSFRPIEA